MRYSAIHNSAYVTYQLHSAPSAQRVEPCIVGCCCLCLLAWLIGYTSVVSKVVFTDAVCTYVVSKVISHLCSLHLRRCNVSCQLQRLLERSLSSSSFSSSPSPYPEPASRPGLVQRSLTMNRSICSLCLCLQWSWKLLIWKVRETLHMTASNTS